MAASAVYSTRRVFCADYGGVHKKPIYKLTRGGAAFVQVGENEENFQKLFPDKDVSAKDYICMSCKRRYIEKLKEIAADVNEEELFESDVEAPFSDTVTEVEELNRTAEFLDITPVKKPWQVRSNVRIKYAERKRKQIEVGIAEQTTKRLSDLYSVNLSPHSQDPSEAACNSCDVWVRNINSALSKSQKYNDKVRIVTLIPDSYSKNRILELFPQVTKHMIDRARLLMKTKGMYEVPDPYSGHPLNEDYLKLAMSYYLDDSLDCSRQSANKNDVLYVKEKQVKIPKVKRYLTRSIKEIYCTFISQHPNCKVGRTKFYSLRPRWVVPYPPHNVCLCVYCANFELCVITLKNLGADAVTIDELKQKLLSLIVCDSNKQECILQECGKCPGYEGITPVTLGLERNTENLEEIIFATWENNELIKKTVNLDQYISHLSKCTVKAGTHLYIKDVQRNAMKDIKETCANTGSLLIHCDFAENWSILFPNETQGYHWKNNQVSIFTAVVYFSGTTHSFGVVSDDRSHDSAHALLATTKILNKMNNFEANIKEVITMSDGAAAHFKNRYQLYEMSKSTKPRKWIYSATGHGKAACDGVGGLLKHSASKHNLSKDASAAIRNAEDFAHIVQTYTPAINIILLPKEEVDVFRQKTLDEWKDVAPIKGLQKSHVWTYEPLQKCLTISRTAKHIPITVDTLKVSSQAESDKIGVTIKFSDLCVDQFITCMYENEWWVAKINELNSELQDVNVDFMLPHGPANGFKFPFDAHRHRCDVPIYNILRIIQPPSPVGSSTRLSNLHAICKNETDCTELLFSSRKS